MLHAANLGPILHRALLIIWVPLCVTENHFATLFGNKEIMQSADCLQVLHNIHVHVVID